jgi:ankyrin repeat protein
LAATLAAAAVRGDDLAILRLCAANPGLDVNVRDHQGVTPLGRAASCGQAKCVDALLQAHADIGCRSNHGSTMLHFASVNGNVRTAEVLIEASTQQRGRTGLDDANFAGDCPLHTAALFGQADVVKL